MRYHSRPDNAQQFLIDVHRFVQAAMHVNRITSLCTVEEVEEAAATLSSDLSKTYRSMILDMLDKHPGPRNLALFRRMFIWLCQAHYCLPLPDFVAMVNLSSDADGRINRKALPMRPEAFCWRLGAFLNLDRHVDPPEVNLSHASMEQYLQSPQILKDDALHELHFSPREAQGFLAEECLRFLQMEDFSTPLLCDSDKAEIGTVNPFKGLHGGLSIAESDKECDSRYPLVERMRSRLRSCAGFEYATGSWPQHVRNAEYTVKDFREQVLPVLDAWSSDAGHKKYRSWQEAHAFFCFAPKCPCDTWQPVEKFLESFKLLDLYKRAKSKAGGTDDDYRYLLPPSEEEDLLDAGNGIGMMASSKNCPRKPHRCIKRDKERSSCEEMMTPVTPQTAATTNEAGAGGGEEEARRRATEGCRCPACELDAVEIKKRHGKIMEERPERIRVARGYSFSGALAAQVQAGPDD